MNALPDPSPGHLWLLMAPGLPVDVLMELAARLALRGELRVVDGGNRFNAYTFSRSVAHLLAERRLVREGEPIPLRAILEHVHASRAFTCYQMLTLLSELPAGSAPTLALDLLATFYDESVPALECQRLLEVCIGELKRLSYQAPVVVSARPAPPGLVLERAGLLDLLQVAAHEVWTWESIPPLDPQLKLGI